MTPAQLRAFSAVVRCGSVREAAVELDVTEAAVSFHIAQLRKELADRLFVRAGSGLAFTPGGLRLASRAAEMLGLQDRTVLEVSQAGRGRRMLQIAASSLFAEHAAPGLIELFTARADDLDVELSVEPPSRFETLLRTRTVDVAIGPEAALQLADIDALPFLNYRLTLVTGAEHPLAGAQPTAAVLREQTWLLGPSAVQAGGLVAETLRRLAVPESRMRIFQSQAAALEEARRHRGIALAVTFAAADDLRTGRLVEIHGPGTGVPGRWSVYAPPRHSRTPVAAELLRFITTPRAIQAMLRGSGVNLGHFRPSIHVTLWS
ncbi:MAG TPA: LysR family transcriptional regulator [Pseudonocardia sp.]|nr:LysR family transcriptional regulator [Pseudonocardia sp.]